MVEIVISVAALLIIVGLGRLGMHFGAFYEVVSTMMLALAELELGRIRDGWAVAQSAAVGRGVHISARVPAGYLRNGDGRLELEPALRLDYSTHHQHRGERRQNHGSCDRGQGDSDFLFHHSIPLFRVGAPGSFIGADWDAHPYTRNGGRATSDLRPPGKSN